MNKKAKSGIAKPKCIDHHMVCDVISQYINGDEPPAIAENCGLREVEVIKIIDAACISDDERRVKE